MTTHVDSHGRTTIYTCPVKVAVHEKSAKFSGKLTGIWTGRQLFLYSTKTYEINKKRYPVTRIYARIGIVDPVVRLVTRKKGL